MNPEQFGLTGETTQALSGGIFAAAAREYLRPALGLSRRIFGVALCLGGAWLFGDDVAHYSGINLQIASAAAGLACIGVANSLLKAVDRLDLTAIFKRGAS